MKKGVEAKDRLVDVFSNPVNCYDKLHYICEMRNFKGGQFCSTAVQTGSLNQ
jgi:hypothetical protein